MLMLKLAEMKGSYTLVASVLTASTAALTSSSSASASPSDPDAASCPCSNKYSRSKVNLDSLEKEKFAPRFDGLRFMETLITAHR
ncbi:hypothetical protein SAY87_021048 [Trapa incisa]|uniref:Uncharacterized protein n=1 Tax=Trapa incisa TaxID=236973 RepID=A0AAN7JQN8_9MYRT|nr:hypothetical protein SAY87_021048 [Trapa incisa]